MNIKICSKKSIKAPRDKKHEVPTWNHIRWKYSADYRKLQLYLSPECISVICPCIYIYNPEHKAAHYHTSMVVE
jgi:hypothetical protein